MDESVINGANLFFPRQFGIDPGTMGGSGTNRNQWLLGLVNSAPYLCCAVAGCWLSAPLNARLGRRGTIFVGACVCLATCVWQAVSDSWQLLFAARFVLGLGIGPNSATVPVFAGECAPTAIRGSLVGMWQVFTAFGIMLGYVMDLAFQTVPDTALVRGLNWRLMLGSAGIPALFLLVQIWFCPESPRWLASKGRYADAWHSLLRLRRSPIQAARDLYYIQAVRLAPVNEQPKRGRLAELFGVRRNRRAAYASLILMFMQQLCGVNAIADYSSNVFSESGFTNRQALLASWGFGLTNWLFAFPALLTIETFGRRRLVLTSYPLMALFLLMTGLAFLIPQREPRVGVIAAGIYLFAIAYSPGAGPVPFAYSAEAYPMAVRDFGMSLSTAWLWFFNFVVAITFPPLVGAFTATGAFAWYAAWNCIGFVLVFFLVPETKGRSLEDLDNVFSQPGREYALERLQQWKRVGHGAGDLFRRRHRKEGPQEESRAGGAV
ncbi:sugar porter family MFS transporter [Phanerochaete sordida]|uniref:Sugar porter family MFS transporter n=1 Tax=Phanerochaete sordida TaxID=48140 RepID=A0A9P3G580_9APHY|nr:sugar porter family MFS transporter [Phanerochaete sordida]